MAWTASKSPGTAGRISTVVPSASSAYTAVGGCAMLTSSRGACVDGWVHCENDSMRNSKTAQGSVGSIDSIGSSGSILSIGSSGSILSIGSSGSILSIGSAGSVLSIASVGSVASVLSIGSAASVGSVLSALSQWSLLAWRGKGKRP